MPDYTAFGERIQQLRTLAGIATQGELAHQLGTTQQTVSRWEAGTSRPRPNELAKLAAALNVDVIDLSEAAGYMQATTTVSFDRHLPLPSLLPESFESFCLDLLSTHFQGQADVQPAGKTGHKQYGIDIEARFINNDLHTYQCKRVAQFGPANVKSAIKAQTVQAKKKFILLSRVASPDARAEINQTLGWYMWDQADISRIFRTLPKREQVRIVDIYFPTQRFALTGELAAGPWQSVEAFFAPMLVEGLAFNLCWKLVGRETELNEISQALADQDALAISIIGRAGDGKSRLLRSVLEMFVDKNPEVRVVVASPSDEITSKSLEDLGKGQKLLVVDDLHDRSDLSQLIGYAANPQNQARLLLVYRTYWDDFVQHELARRGLCGKHVKSISLRKPTKQDAIALASQVLAKNSASTDAAEAVANVAYDSPLAVVVGAQIVANDGLHPELFGSHDIFRTTVLKQYEKVIAQGIAREKDQEYVHKILRVLALIQPVVPDDKHTLELLTNIEGIGVADSTRLVRLLINAGVLFKRGTKYRLSPDLLADSIIETACITENGESNGYAEKLFAAAIPEHKEHVLLNLGRLDWRRNVGDTSESLLLNKLWAQLSWEDDYVNAQVRAAEAAAYFQPRQALDFAKRLINSRHIHDEEVSRIIQGATYHLKYLTDACSLLWEIGQNDRRPTNQHPNHAIRVLMELATPDPRKSVDFLENVVDFTFSILEYPESWSGAYTPYDLFKGALATQGHFTSAATSRQLTISTYAVRQERVAQIRKRIISELLASLSNPNQRRAFLAAQHLSDAIRGPMAQQHGADDSWGNEFVDTLGQINELVDTVAMTAPVLVKVAESVSWHAFYGPDSTKTLAEQIILFLDRDLETRTVRVFMDAWGSNTWALGETEDKSPHDIYVDDVCRELGTSYPDPAQLENFLHERLNDISLATGTPEYAPAQLFLDRLFRTNLAIARHLVQSYLQSQNSLLSPFTGLALGNVMTHSPAEATKIITSMRTSDKVHLQVIAEAYLFAKNLGAYSELDIQVLKRIFASRDAKILRCACQISHEVAKSDKSLAIELIASVDMESALHHIRDFFMWITHESTIPFEKIRDDQLKTLIFGLRKSTRLDDYWINEFLKKAIKRLPGLVIELAKTRIDDAISSGDWKLQPLGNVLRNETSLNLMSLPQGPEVLRDLLNWALERIDDYAFRYRFSELIQALCHPYETDCITTIEDWLSAGTAAHFKVVIGIIRDAGQRFVFNHEGFVARVLKKARSIGKKAHQELSSAIFEASVTGIRGGAPGQPFSVDVELKEMSEKRLALLVGSDPTFELYSRLRDHAVRAIDAQLEIGRRMDEDDADGGIYGV